MSEDAGLTRRRLLGTGAGAAATFGALAVGSTAGSAAAAPDLANDVALGATPSALAPAITAPAVPPLVPGATMVTKSLRDAVGYRGSGGDSSLTSLFSGGIEAAYSDRVVLCPLDIPPRARLVRVDYFGYRASSGTQAWRLLRFDATTGQSTVANDTTSSTGTGLIQTTVSGLDLEVSPGVTLIADLLGSSADNAFVSVMYQMIGPGQLFHPLTPTRVYDSRWAGPAGRLFTDENRTVSVKDGRDLDTGGVTALDVVPAGATAVAYNLTIAESVNSGFLAVTPGGSGTYAASSINWPIGGAVLANAAIVNVNANRDVTVFCGGLGGSSTQFIIDITGFFATT